MMASRPKSRYLALMLHCVGHGQAVRMVRHRHDVLGSETRALLQDPLTHTGQRESMLLRVVAIGMACLLNGLQRDSTNAFPRQRVFDDRT
jgi:hypothetical protein